MQYKTINISADLHKKLKLLAVRLDMSIVDLVEMLYEKRVFDKGAMK